MTAERYTAVFTGLFTGKKPGEYLYLSMSQDPLTPGGSALRRGRAPYERMGREVSFEELPEDCRRLVLDVYRELWDLPEDEEDRPQRSRHTLAEERTACELPVSPMSRFQDTQHPELRFRALLTDGTREVRFERVAAG